MSAVLLWLPPAAAGEIERLLEKIVDDWSARWMASPRRCQAAKAGGVSRHDLRWWGSNSVAAGCSPSTLTKLGLRIVEGHADSSNPRDSDILERVGATAIADLAEMLPREDQSMPADGDGPAAPADARYQLSGIADIRLEIGLSAAASTHLRLHLAKRRREPVLGKLSAALSGETIRLGCHLGEARLLAADVAGLAKGDLIVLERGTSEPLPITVEGEMAAEGSAILGGHGDGGTVRMRIAKPINLEHGKAPSA